MCKQNLKYCSYYSCDRVLPEGFEGDTCPYCEYKNYSFSNYIKDLPKEAYEVEMKCKKCESTKDLKYYKIWYYGSRNQYSSGNYYECAECDAKWRAELKRQEEMKFILINDDNENGDLIDNKEAVEKMFEDFLGDYYMEDESNPFEDWVLLKVEKIEYGPKKEDFEKRNVIQFDDEWYRVEEICDIEYEYSGDHSVSF